MEAKQIITENLKKVLKKIGVEDIELEVKISPNLANGDYYTNVALRLSSILKQKPLDIAYKIKDDFGKALDTRDTLGTRGTLSKVEVVPPGFVNFFLSERYLTASMIRIIEAKEEFGRSDSLKNKKVMVEFTDPNPFKEFHIGHLYSNIVGESLARLFESGGAEVMRVCYQGDVGMHVAKAIWGMRKILKDNHEDLKAWEVKSFDARILHLGLAYSTGAKAYEEDEKAKNEIGILNKKIYDKSDGEINEFYEEGKAWSLKYFDALYERLGTTFKKFYFESEAGKVGLEIVQEFLKKGIFEKSDGAIIFPGEKFGLHNRVFINSLGLPTYEAKELGLAPTKYRDFEYDESVIVTANEVDEYFRVVLKALEQIDPELAKKTKHISHGIVRLPGGKMSSRFGNILTGEWLMDEAHARVQKEYSDMDEKTSEKVGLAAIKFALLKNGIGRDVNFSFNESISLNGASGPYLQYTYVRTRSLFEKSQKSKVKSQKLDAKTGLKTDELAVLRQLVYFPEVVSMAAEKYSPNLVAEYLFELSQKFNLFYQKHQVIGNKFRLELSEAVGQVLKNGLTLLGIETVERM